MREQFLKHIANTNLFGPSDPILLAVSGGLDSMVMLHLFHSCHFQIGVAHANFQLREEESDRDEQFLKTYCEANGIPFFHKRFDTNNYAAEHQMSIQMAARELRYAWFEELRSMENFKFVATAHHLDDSIETVIINLVNGRGADGLAGIEAKAGTIIRPLLFATRLEVNQYAAKNEIVWREDESNATTDYKRNFIRHEVMPRLRELNPAIDIAVGRSMFKTRGILSLSESGKEIFESKFVQRSAERVSILKSGLRAEPHAASVLYAIAREFGFSIDQCGQIAEALNRQPGALFVSNSHQLVIDREQIIISRQSEPLSSTLIENVTTATLGNLELIIETTSQLNLHNGSILLDADKVKFPLTWRPWKNGDSFYPLGMTHRKKVSDYLINNKIPFTDKSYVTVLESDGEIIWLVGHRISEHFKITPHTVRGLRLTLQPYFI